MKARSEIAIDKKHFNDIVNANETGPFYLKNQTPA